MGHHGGASSEVFGVSRARFVKSMGVSVLAAGCVLAAASPALAIYYPSGPQTFVPKSQLKGWQLCFSGFYSDTESLETVLSQCDRDPLLLAGGPTGSETLTVLAAAPRDDVLFDTGQSNDPHNANGSGWYFNSNWSWGFAKKGDPIKRDECDVRNRPHSKLRLCWHTLGGDGMLSGGYRAGAEVGLNGSTDYTRYIYQGPPPCPRQTLCVWKHEDYQGKRLTIDRKGISNEIARELDDEVTSFYNRRDGVSYLYEDKNGEGSRYCIPQHASSVNIGDVFDDLASSSKLTNKVAPSEEPPC